MTDVGFLVLAVSFAVGAVGFILLRAALRLSMEAKGTLRRWPIEDSLPLRGRWLRYPLVAVLASTGFLLLLLCVYLTGYLVLVAITR